LTELEFMHVRNPSVFWTSLGSVLSTFAIGSGLDKINDLMKAKMPITVDALWIPGVILVLGVVCFALSGVLSKDRRAVMKRIKLFFKANPGQPEVRGGGR